MRSLNEILRVKIKVLCYEDISEDFEENRDKTEQRIRFDNMDLLVSQTDLQMKHTVNLEQRS